MNIKKISLFSLIFIAISTLNNTILSMESDGIKKNIEIEMQKLNKKIINFQQNIDFKESQNKKINEKINEIKEMQKEREAKKIKSIQLFEECKSQHIKTCDLINQLQIKYGETISWWQFYTIWQYYTDVDMGSLKTTQKNFDDIAAQLTNIFQDIINLESKIYQLEYSQELKYFQEKDPALTHNLTLMKYFNNATQYNGFENIFKRCEHFNDFDCFKNLEKDILEWNQHS